MVPISHMTVPSSHYLVPLFTSYIIVPSSHYLVPLFTSYMIVPSSQLWYLVVSHIIVPNITMASFIKTKTLTCYFGRMFV